MRKLIVSLLLVAAGLMTTFAQNLTNQKKPLTHDVYDQWQSITSPSISAHGLFTLWIVTPQEGDATLYVRNNKTGVTTTIPRAYGAVVTRDEKHLIAKIKPQFFKTREAKIKKLKADAMPKDSLVIVDLTENGIKKFENISSFKMGTYNTQTLAFYVGKPKPEAKKATPPTTEEKTAKEKKAEKKAAKKKDKKNKKNKAEEATPAPAAAKKESKDAAGDLALYTYATGDTMRIKYVSAYEMSRDGKWLVYVRKTDKYCHEMCVMNLGTRETTTVTPTFPHMGAPILSQNSKRFMFLATTDTVKSGSQHCDIYEYSFGGQLTKRVDHQAAETVKKGWGITASSAPSYNKNGDKIFVKIQPYIAPNDTSKHDFETAEPNIWRYDADLIPPMLKVSSWQNGKYGILCSVVDGKLVRLANSVFDAVSTPYSGNCRYAISIDGTGREVQTQWDYQVTKPFYLVDAQTGSRIKVAEGKLVGQSISPDTKHVVWYDLQQREWMLWNVQTKQSRSLTASMKVNFYQEDDDHPMLPSPYGGAAWTSDSKGVIVPDRFDLWYLPVDGGKPVNLTAGKGRKDSIRYRYVNTQSAEAAPGINKAQPLYLSVYSYKTKEYGYARTDFNSRLTTLLYGPYTYKELAKADSADVFIYRKGNFQIPTDLYLLTDHSEKLSAINPQQKEYNWGVPELFQWKAFDGTPLDGVLYKPENFDANKKYPVMIYFYERRSESLYNSMVPAPSRSTVNIPYFVSNGYIVFVPDIAYKDGHPGESAYNCIVSGAKALAKNKWVDSSKMAIQGQSWGGYQVAYLVTRTDMFAAAGAGAPVSNMTSAYGGIRWGTGISRQFQYEHTQSRIGKDLWSGYDLYVENSPIFKLPNVKTPLLIMHNNNDGAVPYYQGIEMFMGLRRLGKPCWLLEYNREAHNLAQRKNAKDLSVRLSDFFDHYLKGAPMPAWMKPSTPYVVNGKEITVE